MALPRDVDLPDRRPPSPGNPSGGGTRPTTNPSEMAEVLGSALPMVIGTARVGPCPVLYWGPPYPGPGGHGTSWDVPYIADPATGLLRSYKGSVNPAVYGICEAPVTAIAKLYSPHFGLGVLPTDALVKTTRGTQEIVVAATGVSAWSGYAGTPAEGMGHQGTVQIRMTHCFSGENGVPREFDAEVQGYGAGAGGESASGDAHPADVLTYLLTDGKNGLGLSASFVNVDTGLPDASGNQTAANSYRRYCSARGWYLSIAVNERTPVVDLIASLLLATDSALVLIAGKLTAVPYGDQVVTRSTFTYTPVGTAAVIDAAELIHEADDPPVQVDRRQEKDIFGIWPVEYVDRAAAYKRLTREYVDPVWTSLYGARRADATSLDWVMTPEHAGWVTHALAQRAIYQRNRYRFRLAPRWALLTPMDLVSLSEPLLGISNLIVRVTAIDEDADGTLSIEATEWPTATAEPIDLTPQAADGVLTTNWRPIPSAPEPQLNAGGGNLLANSRLYDAAGGYGPWTKETSGDTASAQATGGPDGGIYQRLTWTATTDKHGWRAPVAGLLRAVVDYSMSFYARAGSAVATGFEVTGDVAPYDVTAVENPNLTTSWQRYVFRAHWDPTVPTSSLFLRTAAIVAAAGTLDFACAQLEEGAIATGYQPKGGEILPGTVARDQGTTSNVDKDNLWPNPTSEVAPPPGADLTSIEWEGRTDAGGGAYAGSWVRQFAHGVLKGFWVPCMPGARFFEEAMVKRTSGSGTAGALLEIAFFGDYVGGDPSRTALARHDSSASYAATWTHLQVGSAAAPAGTVAAFVGVIGQDTNDYQWDALYARRVVTDGVMATYQGTATFDAAWTVNGQHFRRTGNIVAGHFRATNVGGSAAWNSLITAMPSGMDPSDGGGPSFDLYGVIGHGASSYPALIRFTGGTAYVVLYLSGGVWVAPPTISSNDYVEAVVVYPMYF